MSNSQFWCVSTYLISSITLLVPPPPLLIDIQGTIIRIPPLLIMISSNHEKIAFCQPMLSSPCEKGRPHLPRSKCTVLLMSPSILSLPSSSTSLKSINITGNFHWSLIVNELPYTYKQDLTLFNYLSRVRINTRNKFVYDL